MSIASVAAAAFSAFAIGKPAQGQPAPSSQPAPTAQPATAAQPATPQAGKAHHHHRHAAETEQAQAAGAAPSPASTAGVPTTLNTVA